MPLFAYIQDDPNRTKGDNHIKITNRAPIYTGERWYESQRFLKETPEPSLMTKAGVVFSNEIKACFDARCIPVDEINHIQGLEQEIRRLIDEKHRYINEQFATWPKVTKDDCEEIKEGRPRAEVVRSIESRGGGSR